MDREQVWVEIIKIIRTQTSHVTYDDIDAESMAEDILALIDDVGYNGGKYNESRGS